MSRVPFHRRVLLWVFFIAFVAIAPAVVFYTSGYRWNPKKGVIERNGTLIIDTFPKGASIKLNGASLLDATPVTLQNITPGTYQVTLTKDGFHQWEKTVDVKPERVTFVNNVRLWSVTEPELIAPAQVTALALSPNDRVLAYVSAVGTSTQLTFTDFTTKVSRVVLFEREALRAASITWNRGSSAVLVQDGPSPPALSGAEGWIVSRSGNGVASQLPDGRYRWNDGRLVGTTADSFIEVVVASGEIKREPLPAGVLDLDDAYSLIHATTTGRQAVIDRNTPGRLLELPEGDWRFADRLDGWLFLGTNDARLGFDPDANDPIAVRLAADGDPDIFESGNRIALLTRHGGEVWLHRMGEAESELLVRQSTPVVGVAWHREGFDVLYATGKSLKALNLDPRDGRRETELETFDDIAGIAVAEDIVYVAGSRAGQSGIWRVRIE